MSSSRSSQKPAVKASFKLVSPFDMFYQLTYMSAMASAGITRAKTFDLAARVSTPAAEYFVAINRLVHELRYDYPEACRRIGSQSKSENMRSFLLRLSDALRSGDPLAEFLTREAEAQSEEYESKYERDLEALKQWSNAFTSILISVALIVIIQVISAMIFALDRKMMLGLVFTGLTMGCFGAWIIWRSAPKEVITIAASKGSAEQQRALHLLRTLLPLAFISSAGLLLIGMNLGWILIWFALLLLPIGMTSLLSDRKTNKKDVEFSTFLRSTGSMATSSGTTLNRALGKIDLTSFPTLEPDISRLSMRLQALVEPGICWNKFGTESGSRLMHDVIAIFYSAIKIGGDPERVGYLCSLFTAKTAQLRAKRRLTAGTFAGLTTVMQTVVAVLMVFVLSIVHNFAELVKTLAPSNDMVLQGQGQQAAQITIANFSSGDLQFLTTLTFVMIVLIALVSAIAIILSDGGYKLKIAFYLTMTLFISGICLLIVPPMVSSILTI